MAAATDTAAGTPAGRVLQPGRTHRERNSCGGPAPLLMHLPTTVPWLSGGPRLLLVHPEL